MSDTLKEIADNLWGEDTSTFVDQYNNSYLNVIAAFYGVGDLDTSADIMAGILTAVGGNPATSTDYLQDIVLELGGTVTINGNWMEAWEAITSGPAAAPVNTVLPNVTGTAVVGNALTTTNGTWTNSPTSYAYQWKRGATNIGTNANSYTLVNADAGQSITCVVTATNAVGSANATSNILYIYDLDAQTFITDAGITDSTEKGAINDLVIGLKSDSLWNRMLAVYPFVGNTSTQQRYNLKDTLTFKITFNGGWTHSSTGALPDGSTSYANTGFIPATSWATSGNSSISAYSRTNNSNAGLLWGTRTGNGNTRLEALLRSSGSTTIVHNSNSTQTPSPAPTTSAINFMSSRINTTDLIIAVNGVASSYVKAEVITSTLPIYLSAQNNNGVAALFSNRELAFAHIGTGLTTGQCTSLYTRIQEFQTRLGRQV